jgi:hypothetical protein
VASGAPSVASGPPSVASSKPSQPSKPSGQAPSKGPKTFEEMGVPSAKNDSDCVCTSMLTCLEKKKKKS